MGIEYQLKIGGIVYPNFININFKRSAFIKAQKFTVTLPFESGISPGSTVEILRGGSTRFKGTISMTALPDDGKTLKIQGFDYKRKLKTLEGVVTAAGTEAGTHISNQFANTDLTGTFNSYGVHSVDYGADTNILFNRDQVIEDILFGTGWELNMSPTGVCNFKSQFGTDRSASVIFRRGENLLHWIEDYVEDDLLKVKQVKVIGKGIGSLQAYGIAEKVDYSAGDPVKSINRPTLPSGTICESAADALLDDMELTLKYGVIQVFDDPGGVNFDVFDTVGIVDEKLGIEEDLRVVEIDINVSPEGEVVVLTVANIAHLNTSGELLLGLLQSRTEDNYTRSSKIVDMDSLPDGDSYARVLASKLSSGSVNHDAAVNVSDNDHHDRSHKTRHQTGGYDPLDIASDGIHDHPYVDYVRHSVSTLYAASTSGGSPTTAFKAITNTATRGPVDEVSVTGSGSHNHDVIASPSIDLKDIPDDEKIRVFKDEIEIKFNQWMIPVSFNGGLKETLQFPLESDYKRIIKQLKGVWHRRQKHQKQIEENVTVLDLNRIPDIMDWDEVTEQMYIDAQLEEPLDEADAKKTGEAMDSLFNPPL